MIQWAIRSQASFEREWKVQRLIAKPKSRIGYGDGGHECRGLYFGAKI